MTRVVVDTNIIFSAMMNIDSSFAKEMLRLENEIFVCETTLVEIFKTSEVSETSEVFCTARHRSLSRRENPGRAGFWEECKSVAK
jgi:predicted nucleic acid-binding protein